ncbi:MAG: hypothetical protein RLZZ579_932, partial [Actinomycetota bacterium]
SGIPTRPEDLRLRDSAGFSPASPEFQLELQHLAARQI